MQEKSALMSVKGVFHLIGSISFAFGCYYDWNYVNVPRNVHQMGVNFAGKLKFLTFWDAVSFNVFLYLMHIKKLSSYPLVPVFYRAYQGQIFYEI